jgi:hypothetical protein
MSTIFDTAKRSFTYETFNQLLNTLFSEGKTTGNNQSKEYLFYAKLNLQRMKRLDKTFGLRKDISDMMTTIVPQNWWVITEGWCGDSAQCLPAIEKMVEASNGKVALQIVLRDENPQIMDQYLTNGTSRSIPILAAFNKEGSPLFKWGPRPHGAQMLLTAWRNNPAPPSFEEFEKEMHTWYAQDKGNTLQDEFRNLLQN